MVASERKSRAAVVLGATGGVGSALCRRLASSGWNLLIAGRNSDRLAELSREWDCESCEIDAARPESFEAAIEQANERFGTVDGIANCVGSVMLKSVHATSYEEWDETIATNLTSAFAVMRSAARVMRKSGGAVVLVSSAAARVGLPNHEAIAAAKAGIIGLTLSSAATYAARNIRVNAVAPGLVKSHMTERLWQSEAAAGRSTAMHPLGRLGEPDEVAGLIAWLLDPSNDWITAQVIGIDGGLAAITGHTRG